jgi:hypothetical protein
MKMIGLSLAAVAMWSSCTCAIAQQQTPAAGLTDATQAVESVVVTGQRAGRVTPQEFKDYEYEYGLSNGEAVRFSRRVGRYYVSIKGRPPVEIFSTATNEFFSSGGARLIFTDNGDKLKIDRYEAIQIASGLPVAGMAQAPK